MREPLLVLLTGAPGAGKSSALTRVHDDLADAGVDSAAIDADELARSYPPVGRDRHRGHLAALSTSFREQGFRLLLVAVAAESDADLRRWLDATGTADRLVVHLRASPSTVERRVLEREPDEWSGLAELVSSAKRLASVRLDGADLMVDTDDCSLGEVAARIEAEVRARLDAT